MLKDILLVLSLLSWSGTLTAQVVTAQGRGGAGARASAREARNRNFRCRCVLVSAQLPLFRIERSEIQQIYYYRWKLFRSHIREIGPQGTTVLEFLDNVPWARQPYTDLNDSASFHIFEGRWLRDPAIVDSLIDHLYTGGANDRALLRVHCGCHREQHSRHGRSPVPRLRHLDTMQHIFNLWDDHLDRARNLY